MKKRLCILIAIVLVLILVAGSPGYAQPEQTIQNKELNFVFLHGAGGSSSDMQLLADIIDEKLPAYIAEYEAQNPGIKVVTDSLNRNYPNTVDINTWATNVATSINKYINPKNLIVIGHSMGGKTALYMTSHGIGNLNDKIAAVVSINSPLSPLSNYYFIGGADYWQAAWLIPQDKGVLNSLAYYDSTIDGEWMGKYNKRWLALISAEGAPSSSQFDTNGIDPLPRDMDDMIIPISCQYTVGADVIYYGQHSHNEFTESTPVASQLADYILRYVFGGTMQYSVLSASGSFGHQAGLFPVVNNYSDIAGEYLVESGEKTYNNTSFTHWLEWTDIIGEETISGSRSSFKIKVHCLPLLSGLIEARWLYDTAADGRIYVRIRVSPRSSVRIEWSADGYQLQTVNRDHYEVEIKTGTPFTGISEVNWVNINPHDSRIYIKSQAEGPLRWFQANWRTYYQEDRERKVIDDIPAEALRPI